MYILCIPNKFWRKLKQTPAASWKNTFKRNISWYLNSQSTSDTKMQKSQFPWYFSFWYSFVTYFWWIVILFDINYRNFPQSMIRIIINRLMTRLEPICVETLIRPFLLDSFLIGILPYQCLLNSKSYTITVDVQFFTTTEVVRCCKFDAGGVCTVTPVSLLWSWKLWSQSFWKKLKVEMRCARILILQQELIYCSMKRNTDAKLRDPVNVLRLCPSFVKIIHHLCTWMTSKHSKSARKDFTQRILLQLAILSCLPRQNRASRPANNLIIKNAFEILVHGLLSRLQPFWPECTKSRTNSSKIYFGLLPSETPWAVPLWAWGDGLVAEVAEEASATSSFPAVVGGLDPPLLTALIFSPLEPSMPWEEAYQVRPAGIDKPANVSMK